MTDAPGMESISVRRATLADADKVRYRVYSNPSEFVAVIAESALMAVKVSGVAKPYKIMRDLPTEGIAIEAQRMSQVASTERVSLGTARLADQLHFQTEMPEASSPLGPFVPLPLADLRSKSGPRARILTPEMLQQIIDQYHTQTEGLAVAAAVPNVVVNAAPPSVPAPAATAEERIIAAPIALSVEQRITQLADELLPPSTAADHTTPNAAADAPDLSSDDVAKLLNEPHA